jgi:hypothetical protein
MEARWPRSLDRSSLGEAQICNRRGANRSAFELVRMSGCDAVDGSSTRHVSAIDVGATEAPAIRRSYPCKRLRQSVWISRSRFFRSMVPTCKLFTVRGAFHWCMLETTQLTCSPLSRPPKNPRPPWRHSDVRHHALASRFETSALNHSASFDQRRRPETLRTAIATAFFCPTRTTSRFASCDAGVEQITRQHGVVLRHDRNHHG